MGLQARITLKALLALCIVPCTRGALGQSAWDGVWIFDSVHSHINPGQLTIERRGDGYQWGGASGYHARCQGLSVAGPDGFTITCSETAQEVQTTLLEHGQPFSTTLYKLGDAGKTLQVSTEYMHGRHPHSVRVDSYVRSYGTSLGLAGTWQGTMTQLRGPLAYVLRIHDGALYYLDTMEGAETDSKLDGSPSIFLDSHPNNVRWINRWDGHRRIFGTYLVDGIPHLQEILELSPNGRTLKNWAVGDEENVYVLTKR